MLLAAAGAHPDATRSLQCVEPSSCESSWLTSYSCGNRAGNRAHYSSSLNCHATDRTRTPRRSCVRRCCYEFFRGSSVRVIQAPAYPEPRVRTPVAETYAHVLFNCGFAEPQRIEARVASWRHLFDLVRPDLVVGRLLPHGIARSPLPLGISSRNRHRVRVSTRHFAAP